MATVDVFEEWEELASDFKDLEVRENYYNPLIQLY